MKRRIMVWFLACCMLGVTGCGQNEDEKVIPQETVQHQVESAQSGMEQDKKEDELSDSPIENTGGAETKTETQENVDVTEGSSESEQNPEISQPVEIVKTDEDLIRDCLDTFFRASEQLDIDAYITSWTPAQQEGMWEHCMEYNNGVLDFPDDYRIGWVDYSIQSMTRLNAEDMEEEMRECYEFDYTIDSAYSCDVAVKWDTNSSANTYYFQLARVGGQWYVWNYIISIDW